MKKSKLLVALGVLVSMVTGCTTENPKAEKEPQVTPPATKVDETAASPAPTETATSTNTPNSVDPLKDITKFPFTLSEDEQKVFDTYVKDLDISIFKDVPEKSIFKIFIECGVTGSWEAEYGMFSSEGITMTKEEWGQLNETDITELDIKTRKSFAEAAFSLSDKGRLYPLDDKVSYLEFKSPQDEKYEFYFIKNADGIPLVKFNPFDAPKN